MFSSVAYAVSFTSHLPARDASHGLDPCCRAAAPRSFSQSWLDGQRSIHNPQRGNQGRVSDFDLGGGMLEPRPSAATLVCFGSARRLGHGWGAGFMASARRREIFYIRVTRTRERGQGKVYSALVRIGKEFVKGAGGIGNGFWWCLEICVVVMGQSRRRAVTYTGGLQNVGKVG